MSGRPSLLERLRESGGAVSGPRLAGDIGVSRAAVWKQVQRLVDSGYEIESGVDGYRLVAAPDRLFPAEIERHLRTDRFGRSIVHFEETDSTSTRAGERARAGAPEGELVVAEAQTGGRGRLGRSFFSPRAVSFYGSVVLRPALPPTRAPQITLVAGLAAARAIDRHASGRRARVKWPNDVHLEGRKVCGILTELDSEMDRVRHVVCGIGVNLNLDRSDLPPDLRGIATSVRAETGKQVDRPRFAADLMSELEAAYDEFLRSGFAPFLDDWMERSVLTSREVVVSGAGSRIEGLVRGVDADGALVVELEGGSRERVLAGDVTLRQEG